MNYTVEGKITLNVSLEVEAEDEKSAIELAKTKLNDEYALDYQGSSHDPGDVKFELDAFDEADYPEFND